MEAYSSAKNTSIRMFESDVAEERARAQAVRDQSLRDTCKVRFADKVLGQCS